MATGANELGDWWGKQLPRAIFRVAEFAALFAGVTLAQLLSDSFALLVLEYALILGFFLKAIHATAYALIEKERYVLGILAGIGIVAVTLFAWKAGNDAVRGAIVQIDQRKAEATIHMREIRRQYRDKGMKLGCGDSAGFDLPQCQQLFKEEDAAENASLNPKP